MIEIDGMALTGLAPPLGQASPLKQGEASGTAEESAFAAILGAVGLVPIPSTPVVEQSLSGELAIAFTRPDRTAEAGIATPESTQATPEVLPGFAALQPALPPSTGASAPAFAAAPVQSATPAAPIAPAVVPATRVGRAPSGVVPAVVSAAVAAPAAVMPATSPAATGEVTQVGLDGLPELTSPVVAGVTVAARVSSELRSTVAVGAAATLETPVASKAPTTVQATTVQATTAQATSAVPAAADVGVADVAAPLGATTSPQVAADVASAVAGDARAGSGDRAELGPRAQAGEFDFGPANVDPDRAGVATEPTVRADQSITAATTTPAASTASAASTGADGVAVAGVVATLPAATAQPAVNAELAVVETATSPEVMASRLADTVLQAARVGGDELRLQLNPPELGRLEVRVVESSEGIRVSLVASTREAGELIQQQLPLLRASLEARALQVDRLDVSMPELTDGGSDGAPRDRTAAGGQGEDGPVWSPLAGNSSQEEGTGDGAASVDLGGSRLDAGALDVLA